MTTQTSLPSSISEFGRGPVACTEPGCGGTVVRRSLGAGQSVRRCVRCFRRYAPTTSTGASDGPRGLLRRALNEFVSWRE